MFSWCCNQLKSFHKSDGILTPREHPKQYNITAVTGVDNVVHGKERFGIGEAHENRHAHLRQENCGPETVPCVLAQSNRSAYDCIAWSREQVGQKLYGCGEKAPGSAPRTRSRKVTTRLGMFGRLTAPRSSMALPFRPVDVPAQARSRKLESRGRDDGARNYPEAATSELAPAEQEVVTAISAERGRCINQLAAQLRAYRDALSHLQTAMDIAAMRQSADEALSQFGEIRSQWSGSFSELQRKAVSAQAEFKEFREAKRITRDARPPDNRFMSFCLLVACVVAESTMNGVFFAAGSDSGLIGGVSLALGLSAFNVILGVISGLFFLRLAYSNKVAAKILGASLFVTAAAAAVLFNGWVAHYRDLYQAFGDATAPRAAAYNLIHAPLDPASLYSWLLFFAGMLFSGIATWKGFELDDPYPGYGRHERRRLATRKAYVEQRSQLIDEACEVRDDFAAKARNAIERLRGASAQRQQILNARARMVTEYDTVEGDLAEAGQQLLAIYRRENAVARTDPAPVHFSQRFTFRDRALDRPALRALLIDQGLEHDADSLINELDTLRQRVLAEHAIVLAQVPGEI
jgi:hypothetical protein